MPSSLLEELRGGDPRTLGSTPVVVRQLLRDPSLLGELLEAFSGHDQRLQARAAYALEKVSAARPLDVAPYKEAIVEVLPRNRHWLVRACWCQIVARFALSRDEREAVFTTLRDFGGDASSIVRTFAMQAMVDLARKDPVLREEAMAVVDRALVDGTPAMRARARKLIKG